MTAFEDRWSVATPEGVELELPLAGLGSRFVAAMLDGLLQIATIVIVSFAVAFAVDAAGGSSSLAGGSLVAFLAISIFLVIFGYHVLFETLASGRTPGKRWTGLRVVADTGGPVSFRASCVRNVIRVFEVFMFPIVAMISIVASGRNQRLGDIAGGTLVVREQRAPAAPIPSMSAEDLGPGSETWDVSAVTPEDLATVRRFLARRATIATEARARLAWELAARLRPRVIGPPEDLHPEEFLEQVATVKSRRS